MLKISTIGLSWEIKNDYVMQVVLSNFDISYHGILEPISIGDIHINSLSFRFGITQIGRKTKKL